MATPVVIIDAETAYRSHLSAERDCQLCFSLICVGFGVALLKMGEDLYIAVIFLSVAALCMCSGCVLCYRAGDCPGCPLCMCCDCNNAEAARERAEAEFRRQERERLDKQIRARKEKETAQKATTMKMSESNPGCDVTTITKSFNQDGSVTIKEETVKSDGSKTIKIVTKPKYVNSRAGVNSIEV